MKLLFDYFPILCFFVAYKWHGIYFATEVTIAAAFLQNIVYWLIHKRFEKMHLITLALVTVLGGATLVFHQDIFIKWKPSILYWLFAITLFISHFFSKKPLIKSLLEKQIELPDDVWQKINFAWGLFFTGMGFLNLWIVYHYSTSSWVNFKLFGTLGLTILFIIAQAFYLSRFLSTSSNQT